MKSNQETKLYIAKVTAFESQEEFDKAYATLSAERKNKVDSFKFQKSKLQSLAAGVLLNRALEDAGFGGEIPDLQYNKYGKPYLKNSPIRFNLSHSEEYAICVVSGCEVGCDIEEVKNSEDKIAKRFFCNEEYNDIISRDSDDEKKDLFYRYWTLKESFMKATGMGLKLHLSSFQIILGEKISIKQSVNDKDYSFYEFSGIDGYKCSVCIEGKDIPEITVVRL